MYRRIKIIRSRGKILASKNLKINASLFSTLILSLVIFLKSWSKKRKRHLSERLRDSVFSCSRWQCLMRMQDATRLGKTTHHRTKRHYRLDASS